MFKQETGLPRLTKAYFLCPRVSMTPGGFVFMVMKIKG